jgi:hypothetical protein
MAESDFSNVDAVAAGLGFSETARFRSTNHLQN